MSKRFETYYAHKGMTAWEWAWNNLFWSIAQYEKMKELTVPCKDADDNIFTNPKAVKCPCNGCEDGELEFDGMNLHRTLVFVVCNKCACCHTINHNPNRPK